MQNRPKFKKQKSTPIISLKPREICFIKLGSYKVWCKNCGSTNTEKVKCSDCGFVGSHDSSQKGYRPVAVVYCPAIDGRTKEEAMVLVIPLTTQNQDSEPGTVMLPADDETQLSRPGQALVYQLTAVDKGLFYEENKKGSIGLKEWDEVKEKLKVLLDVSDKNIRFPDGTVMHISQILESLKEVDTLKKEKAELVQNSSESGQLKYKLQQQSAAHDKFKLEQKKELEKAQREIKRLKALLEEVQDPKPQLPSVMETPQISSLESPE